MLWQELEHRVTHFGHVIFGVKERGSFSGTGFHGRNRPQQRIRDQLGTQCRDVRLQCRQVIHLQPPNDEKERGLIGADQDFSMAAKERRVSCLVNKVVSGCHRLEPSLSVQCRFHLLRDSFNMAHVQAWALS